MISKNHRKIHPGKASFGRMLRRGIQKMGFSARNHRKYQRFDCSIPVEIHMDTPGQISIIEGVAHNISAGGMLLKCSEALDYLTPCHLSFKLPTWFPRGKRAHEVMALARVRHADLAGNFYGVAFSAPL